MAAEMKKDPGASLHYGLLALFHGSHKHKFLEWMENLWRLCPDNKDLRDYVKNITADLEASVGLHQPPEVRNTGRINFAASSTKQVVEKLVNEEKIKKDKASRILNYLTFREVFDEKFIVNDKPFDYGDGTNIIELLCFSQQCAFCSKK